MRQKTCFSILEMRSENLVFVSEDEVPDQGIPLPNGPPSSDCPVGWHADDAPRRHRVRDRGSRPVLAQNHGVRVAIPAGVFYALKNTPQGFYIAKNCVFEANGVRVAIPAGASYTLKNTPQGFSRPRFDVNST